MKKNQTKKVKVATRKLTTIIGEIRATLRTDTASVIRRGNLLIEAKAQVEDGKWLTWLDENVSMNVRTAQLAMAAARFASKYESDSYLNLSVTALYAISGKPEIYTDKIVAAILREAETKPVSEERVLDIAYNMRPKPPAPEAADTEKQAEAEAEAKEKEAAEAAAEAAEAAALIDGPPPSCHRRRRRRRRRARHRCWWRSNEPVKA